MSAHDQIGRVSDQMSGLIKIGVVTSVNESGNVQMFQVTFNDQETRSSIPSIQFFGLASSPLNNSSCLMLSPRGYPAQGTIIGTHDSRSRPTGMAQGETQLYDSAGQTIYLQGGTKITVNAKNEVDVVAGNTVNVTAPTVNVTAPTVNVNATSAVTITSPTVNVVGVLKVNGVVVTVP